MTAAAASSAPSLYFSLGRDRSGIAELDGLRAVAIILVLFRHGVRPFMLEGGAPLLPVGPWDAASLFVNGWLGVDLFFVLSGFLIADHLLRARSVRSGFPLARYFLRRILRIVPLYYAVLAAAVLGMFPLFSVRGEALAIRVAYHVLFLQDYLPANIIVAFWSLGVEEKFYMAAPLCLALAMRFGRPCHQYAVVLGLMLVSPALRSWTALHDSGPQTYESYFVLYRSPFHASAETLLAGVLAALLYRNRGSQAWTRDGRRVDALFWGALLPLGWLAVASPLLREITLFDKTLQPTLIAWCAGALLYATALGARPGRWLAHNALYPIAKLSYSLYLVHMALIPLAMTVAGALFAAGDPALRFAAFMPVFLLASGLYAAAFHFAVEKPFLILKDRLR